jgi:hypothetical protein
MGFAVSWTGAQKGTPEMPSFNPEILTQLLLTEKAIEFDLSSEMKALLGMDISVPKDLGILLWLADAVKALDFFNRLLESDMAPEYRAVAESARSLAGVSISFFVQDNGGRMDGVSLPSQGLARIADGILAYRHIAALRLDLADLVNG